MYAQQKKVIETQVTLPQFPADIIGESDVYLGSLVGHEDRQVWVYLPNESLWDEKSKRPLKAIIDAFVRYAGEGQSHPPPSLPAIRELTKPTAKTGVGRALIVDKTKGRNLFVGEAKEAGSDVFSWETEHARFSPTELQKAVGNFLKAVQFLETCKLPLPSYGPSTCIATNADGPLKLKVELLYFARSDSYGQNIRFEPAFTAAEELSGQLNEFSEPARVYSLASFILYFLVGPQRYLELFGVQQKQDAHYSQLFADENLWKNLSGASAGPTSENIAKALGHNEHVLLPDIFTRALSKAPQDRYPSVTEFVQAYRECMVKSTLADHFQEFSGTPSKGGANSKVQPLHLVGAAIIGAAALFGAWFLYDQNNKDQALEAALNQRLSLCRPFFDRRDELSETLVGRAASWSDITEGSASTTALRRQSENTTRSHTGRISSLQESGQLCVDLLAKAEALAQSATTRQTTAINALRNLANEMSLDLAIDFDVLDSGSNQTSVERLNWLETTNKTLSINVTDALKDRIQAFKHIIESSAATNIERSFDAAQKQSNIAEAQLANVTNETDLQQVYSDVIAAETLALTIYKEDVAQMSAQAMERLNLARQTQKDHPPLTTAISSFNVFGDEPQIFAEDQITALYTNLNAAILKADDAIRSGQDKLTQIEDIQQTLSKLASDATSSGFESESTWSALVDTSRTLPEGVTSLDQWVNLLGLMETEYQNLDNFWTTSRANCAQFRTEFANYRPGERHSQIEFLSDVNQRMANLSDRSLTRAELSECDAAMETLNVLRLQDDAQEITVSLSKNHNALVALGGGENYPGWQAVQGKYSTFIERPLPETEDQFSRYLSTASQIDQEFSDLKASIMESKSELATLVGSFQSTTASVEATGLVQHSEYSDLIAGFDKIQDRHLIDQISVVKQRTSQLLALLARYEAGELLDCSFGSVSMVAINVTQEDLAGAISQLSDRATFDVDRLLGQHCIAAKPVSYSDLQLMQANLTDRRLNWSSQIQRLVENATSRARSDTRTGTAVNVSGNLSLRHAEYLSAIHEIPYCLAPAPLARLAASGTDQGAAIPELSSSKCAVDGLNLQLQHQPNGTKAESFCVDMQLEIPKMTYRLAAGDICSSELRE